MGQLLRAFQTKIKVIEHKVHILSAVQMLPNGLAEALLSSCKLSSPVAMLFDMFMGDEEGAMSPEEEEKYFGESSPLIQKINDSNSFLDEGLKIVLEGLNSEECAICGKCEDQKKMVESLLAGELPGRSIDDLKENGLTIHTETIGNMQ